jgi:hypothetical protein
MKRGAIGMKKSIMKLPELNCLSPNEHTTFRKLVEEIAECNTAIDGLRIYEEKHNTNYLLLSDNEVHLIREEYKRRLYDVMSEIMDIAQVCASQLFVFEVKGISVQKLFNEYNDVALKTVFHVENNCRYVHFEATGAKTNLQSTMNLIILAMGNIAQLGKFTGDNGEVPTIDRTESDKKYVSELFEIIQHCFNLLYNMKDKYNIEMEQLFESHVEKLVAKGYCTL